MRRFRFSHSEIDFNENDNAIVFDRLHFAKIDIEGHEKLFF